MKKADNKPAIDEMAVVVAWAVKEVEESIMNWDSCPFERDFTQLIQVVDQPVS